MSCCKTKSNKVPLQERTALVTGASSGIGEAIAIRLAFIGIKTYAAARRTDKMDHLVRHGIHVIYLDITDESSIWQCVAKIEDESGGIDILVNNAGYGSYGAIEEVPMIEARRQMEVNLFGLANLTQLVIPHMREQRWGKIFNISSIGGVEAYPYGGWYHTTKFALEGYSSSLRQELKPFDVDVMIVRPGAIKSEWAQIAANNLQNVSASGPYKKAVDQLVSFFTGKDVEKLSGEPEEIADCIEAGVRSVHPKSVYVAPRHARIMLCVGRWINNDCIKDGLKRKFMRLPKKM
ncbi:MAG: oxidoreductase [Sulfuricurvum sp.]|nr:oxidoreductase [Sulfuricurvum sp.]